MIEFFDIFVCSLIGSVTLLFFLLHISSRKGFNYWKIYYKASILLKSYAEKFRKKLPAYERLKEKDFSAVDVGVIPTKIEYELENPLSGAFQLCSNGSKQCDGIHFFGVDSGGNWIDACINKIGENVAVVWVFLRLSNGEEYRLPGGPDLRTSYIDSEFSFSSSGLQIRCLSPLRRWRISFNGLLQKFNAENEHETELKHVKFSFIWLSMSLARESNIEFSHRDLAKAFANASHDVGFEDLNCFYDMQNKYEQWGQLIGKLCIKGSNEQDLYLWSCRTRILDSPLWYEDISFAKLYMYFKDGYPLKVETTSVKDFISNYTNAHSIAPSGGLQDVEDCDFTLDNLHQSTKEINFTFNHCKNTRKCFIKFIGKEKNVFLGPHLEWTMIMKYFTVTLDNGDEGFGVVHFGVRSKDDLPSTFSVPPILLLDKKIQSENKMVLLLNDDDCKSSLIAGGKGCSLALLTELSKSEQSSFQVPKGFVITTNAFENHINSNKTIYYAVQKLIEVSGEKVQGNLKDECFKCMEEFQAVKLSDSLCEEIQNVLLNMYDSIDHLRFSVRSSACGEDSEDLSAAGQMLTVLGIRGINNIIDAIVKCWSSKFGYEAVQYARQNGQPIKSPMAVVVQEMIPSEVSGVLFTVDPVTGDPSHPYITANYGLGETVVSSLAEPDTFILERNSDKSISVKEKIIGTKRTQIYMNAEHGTMQKTLSCESLGTCLTDEWSIIIGLSGILIESCFCSPRDIEWALHKDKLYLLQARPITTLHTETDFELTHDQDTPQRSDVEFWTRANTGEVFLGATTPLGISLVVCSMDIFNHRNEIIRRRQPESMFCPYFFHMVPITHKQVTISIVDTLYRSNEKEISTIQKALEVGIFGRSIGTKEIHQAGIKRYGYISKWNQVVLFGALFLVSYRAKQEIKQCSEKIRAYKLPIDTYTDIANTWKGLLSQMCFYNDAYKVHGMATFISSFLNLIVLYVLAKGKEVWDAELYSDFASLLSSCTGVESADVPESLQEIAQVIAKHIGLTFSSLTDDMAYETLLKDNGPAGKLFKEFFEKHGHRCIKEFDVYSVSWGMKPKELIPSLKNLVASPNILNPPMKREISIETEISKLKTPMTMNAKRILKFILPRSRQAVGQREQTKSLLIKTVDWYRQTCLHLGKLMVEEGMLPDRQLLFFLTLDEIYEMIETRRPGLVNKALRRSRLHPKLNKLQFPEIIKGTPRPIEEEEEELSKYSSSFTLTGIPVCQGQVKGVARVVIALSEACTIQSGDILVTHSTDIGWTPYFPLLSGVVTVLGGLISHGAVVAREYGLPCVVGVQKATSAFKSGDTVILDGTKGTITKLISDDMQSNEL